MRRLTAWLTTPGWIAHLFDGIKTKRKLAKIPENQEGPIIANHKNSTLLKVWKNFTTIDIFTEINGKILIAVLIVPLIPST